MDNLDFQNAVNLDGEWINGTSSREWQDTFYLIQYTLEKKLKLNQVDKILNVIVNIIDKLVKIGDAYESLVLKIAQLYIFKNLTGFDLKNFKSSESALIINAAEFLYKYQDNHKVLFETEDYPYLYKIRLAELIFKMENGCADKNLLNEVDEIILDHKNDSQKGLMKKLISVRKKVGK